jgi:hypothetical protein
VHPRVVGLIAGLALLIVACGSDSAPTPQPRAGLKARLLVAGDLPSGYRQQPDTDADDTDKDDLKDDSGAGQFCPEVAAFEDSYEPDEEAEVNFVKGELSFAGGSFVNQSLGRFDDPSEADQAFDAYTAALRACKAFETGEADGGYKATITAVAFPTLGDETYAARLAGEGQAQGKPVTIAGDFVVVRKGDTMMLVITLGFGALAVPAGELEDIARTAAAKL